MESYLNSSPSASIDEMINKKGLDDDAKKKAKALAGKLGFILA